jgi:hypothetical protein
MVKSEKMINMFEHAIVVCVNPAAAAVTLLQSQFRTKG